MYIDRTKFSFDLRLLVMNNTRFFLSLPGEIAIAPCGLPANQLYYFPPFCSKGQGGRQLSRGGKYRGHDQESCGANAGGSLQEAQGGGAGLGRRCRGSRVT